jgi:hypothetical protein
VKPLYHRSRKIEKSPSNIFQIFSDSGTIGRKIGIYRGDVGFINVPKAQNMLAFPLGKVAGYA